MISHGGEIAKIAIVAERRWETLALGLAGAGVRRASVKFLGLTNWTKRWLAE
jgi:hypothetical protein